MASMLKVNATISKLLDVPVTTAAYIYQRFKVHRTVANLPENGHKKTDEKLK